MADDDVAALVIDIDSSNLKAGFAGDNTPRKVLNKGSSSLKYPIENGVVTDWDAFEALLRHTFDNELQAAPEEHPILVTEPPLNSEEDRARLAAILFEKFNSPAIYVSNRAFVSLYASGRTTGTVFIGDTDISHAVPIYEGYALSHAIIAGASSASIHEAIYNSIAQCDTDIQKDLYANIVLAGNPTLASDIATQVQTGLTALAPSGTRIQVIAPPERENSAWIGGSIIASLSTFQQMWMSKQECDESGAALINQKCA